MLKLTTTENDLPEENGSYLDELARQGARKMIATAIEMEVADYIAAHRDLRDENGRALVVRNGRAKDRKLLIGCGTIDIAAPRVNDRRSGIRFTSSILPPYMRKSPAITEVLPILYLKGLSTGDFSEALESLLGKEAKGLSATTITRLKAKWYDEYSMWRRRNLSNNKYAYIFADGVSVSVRLGDDPRICLLVVIGVTESGVKELLAIEDGFRESKESWASVLRDLKRRGMNEPIVSIGDGALGLWAAIRGVWPSTKEQRCWVHKIANVLDKLPRRLQAKAKESLHEIMKADSYNMAIKEMDRFRDDYMAKYPKAVECLLKDKESLLTFYDFPAQHWLHLRTTNPIESTFSTVKARTKITKGAGSRTAALSMAFKLLESAEKRWRKINGACLVSKVMEGVIFKDGIEQAREKEKVVA